MRAESTAETAAWVTAGLPEFGALVRQLVPPGFAAVARVFHPVEEWTDGHSTRMRWSEVADRTGTRAHPAMQWASIGRGLGPDFHEPAAGSMTPEVAARLADVLAAHSPDGPVSFAVWEGWGGFDPRGAVRFSTPNRAWHLYSGELGEAADSISPPLDQLPSMWWPRDRSWFTFTEVDLDSTLVAGSREVVDAILAEYELESLEVSPVTDLSIDGDIINPRG